MTNCQEARVKPKNTQLSKLKSAAKYKTWTILKLNKRKFEYEKMPYELFLTARQTTVIRNVVAIKC